MISLMNTTSDIVRVYIKNTNDDKILLPNEDVDIFTNNSDIYFSISSDYKSNYGSLKTAQNTFSVIADYCIKPDFDNVRFNIIRQEAEDEHYKKYLRFVVSDELPFSKIEYSIKDKVSVLKKEKKNARVANVLNVVLNMFDIGLFFAIVGLAVGMQFGRKAGILCFVVLFLIYNIIELAIDVIMSRKMKVKNFITSDYIENVFKQSGSNNVKY